MKVWKRWLLSLVVFTFSGSLAVSGYRHSQINGLLAESTKTTSWAVSELERELLLFSHGLRRMALSDMEREQLALRFELLWSRINLLQVGDETRWFRSMPGVEAFLREFDNHLRQIEPQLRSLSKGDPQALLLERQLTPFSRQLRELTLWGLAGKEARGSLQQVIRIQHQHSFFLLGLLLSGGALIVLLLRENAINRRQTLCDSLTGLPNRHAFTHLLAGEIARARRRGKGLALYLLDIDDFQEVNDQYGHAVGDTVLRQIGARLQQLADTRELVAHLGNDSFAILQRQPSASCDKMAARLRQEMGYGVQVDDLLIAVSVSIGIGVLSESSMTADRLLNNANLALYRAKADPLIGVRQFEQAMHDEEIRRRILVRDLGLALLFDRGLKQVYQPIVSLSNGRIVSVEALLRWRHHHYGVIPPQEVVALAEQAGLAHKLNEWVLKQACSRNMAWYRAGLPAVQVAVNISPTMYTHHNLVTLVVGILAASGLPPERLVIEVTEDTTMEDLARNPETLQELRRLGVELALDDFGTGYSSLSHLKALPFQRLKIDKSFIWQLGESPKDLSFIRTIIRLAHGLGMTVVAEGIETEEHQHDLYQEGCEFGQGYRFSEPVGDKDLQRLLQQQVMASSQMPPSPRLRYGDHEACYRTR